MTELPLAARLYVAGVVASACVVIALAIQYRPTDEMGTVAILIVLHIVGESLLARGSRDMLSISLGSVTSIAALPLVGVWGAVLVAWTAAFALDRERTPLVKRFFNGAQLALAAAAAGGVYTALGGTTELEKDSFPGVLGPILAADIAHCAVNGALVAVIVGLHRHVAPVVVFQGTMARSVVPYLAYGLFGVSLAVLWDPVGLGPISAVLLLLPLFVARWAYAQYADEQRAYDRTVRTLMAAVETKDVYTRGHSERVSAASVMIARAISMREDRVASLRYAGILHDIGKLGVPTRVLQKSGLLTDDEFAAIQRHPMQGLEIVREIEFLDEANAGIMHHHERLDGLGYPMGLRGDQIPEFARVIAVADAFDSMTTTRSYRGARSLDEAITELRRCAGTQFDPPMVEALVRALDEQGWEPEVTPLFAVPDPDQVFDQDGAALDHDDPAYLEESPVTTLRRRLDDAGTMGYLVVVVAAALLAVAAIVVTASPGGLVDVEVALGLGAFIALGELVRITLPGGRDAAPLATAGALAYVLLTRFADQPANHGALQVVAVAVVAMLVGVAPHAVAGRAPSVDSLARRLLVIGVSAALFRGSDLDQRVDGFQDAGLALVLIAIVVLSLVVDAVLAAAVRAGEDRAPFSAVLRNEIHAQVGIGSAIGATGALIALAATIMGYWALPVFVVPLLLTQFSFRRYAAIRESSLQTIRALSRVTELGGYTESGHSRRVSTMAVAVGRELGMSDADLRDLEYAALMHDIGQLSLAEPIPGGATVVAAPADQARIARLGADVILQTGVLDNVASIVAKQAEPYRKAHEVQARDVPLAARIIKAVNAYDDLVGDSFEIGRRLDALERLRLGMAYEYDPTVVDTLSQTVERTARLGV